MSDHHDHPSEQSPFNAVPPMIAIIALAIFALECMFALGEAGMLGGPSAVGWRSEAIQNFGYSNRAQAWMIENGVLRADFLWRYVTYPFVHASFIHAGFAAVMVLALGKFVGERMPGWAVLSIFLGASIVGVATYGLTFPDGRGYYGAYPGVYGLIGGFTYLVWLRLGQMGENQIRAFAMIGFLLVIQLVFGLMYDGGNGWIADVAGFAAGFGLSFVVAPGGWQKIRSRLQQR